MRSEVNNLNRTIIEEIVQIICELNSSSEMLVKVAGVNANDHRSSSAPFTNNRRSSAPFANKRRSRASSASIGTVLRRQRTSALSCIVSEHRHCRALSKNIGTVVRRQRTSALSCIVKEHRHCRASSANFGTVQCSVYEQPPQWFSVHEQATTATQTINWKDFVF